MGGGENKQHGAFNRTVDQDPHYGCCDQTDRQPASATSGELREGARHRPRLNERKSGQRPLGLRIAGKSVEFTGPQLQTDLETGETIMINEPHVTDLDVICSGQRADRTARGPPSKCPVSGEPQPLQKQRLCARLAR